MDSLARHIIDTSWGCFVVVWLLAAIFTKRTAYHETSVQRFRYTILMVIGWYFIFRGYHLPDPFNIRVIPASDAILLAAAILCICGLGFCFWARAVLGRNWSGTVTLKENHELIMRGPYRLVRHPIYTGLLAMLLATAIQKGHIAAMIGLVIIFVSLWIKLASEEEVMSQQFPDQYAAYRQRVKRIIPFLI